MLTQSRLKEVLHYDPETGIFTRNLKQTGVAKGSIAGSLSADGYLVTSVDHMLRKCHRLAWLYMTGEWPMNPLDHINGVRSDNRFSNLREAPRNINAENQRSAQRSNKSTGILGTFRNGSGFAARISHGNVKVYLGTFRTVDEAHVAYLTAKRLLHEGCVI